MKFAQAMIGLPSEGYTAVAQAAEAAGFRLGRAQRPRRVSREARRRSYPYTTDGKPQYEPEWDFPDPWVTVGAMSSVTTTLEFFTNVFVLPARNPLLVAKTVGTVAKLVRRSGRARHRRRVDARGVRPARAAVRRRGVAAWTR